MQYKDESTTEFSRNWMLDQITKTIGRMLNKDELISELCIQKIEYGIMCIMQAKHDPKLEKQLEELVKKMKDEFKK